MSLLKASFRRWVAVAPVAGLLFVSGCQGADEFLRFSDAGQPGPGVAGATGTGTGGTTGSGGTTGAGGSGGSVSGLGGSGGSVGGTAGSGAGGATGVGGTTTGTGGGAGASGGGGGSNGSRGGAGGTTTTGGAGGATGVGGASSTAGATGSSGRGGATTGSAGAAGAGGATGTGGVAGSNGTGAGGSAAGSTGTGTGGGAGGSAPARIQVQAKCQSQNDMQNIRVTFRVVNPDSVTKQLSDVKVRYYFTLATPLTPMVVFDYAMKIPTSMLSATATDSYVEVSFAAGAGSLAAFDTITGTDQIQLRIYNFSSPTWNASSDDDYSNKSCMGVTNTDAYADRTTMPGYYQGQLAWGSEPAQ